MERLARWLQEWELDLAMRESGHRELLTARPDSVPQLGPEPREGQIRLMHPFNPSTRARPVYVAVLAAMGRGMWRVAPYGRFAEPAFPGEWRTRRKIPCLRVICLWNARALNGKALRRSWVVHGMTRAEQRDACACYGGVSLPAPRATRTGPPLIHPFDPRHRYREEEAGVMTELAEADAADSVPATPPLTYEIPEDRALPLAAETRARYTVERRKRRGSPR
jgi:hypothetical protein